MSISGIIYVDDNYDDGDVEEEEEGDDYTILLVGPNKFFFGGAARNAKWNVGVIRRRQR